MSSETLCSHGNTFPGPCAECPEGRAFWCYCGAATPEECDAISTREGDWLEGKITSEEFFGRPVE